MVTLLPMARHRHTGRFGELVGGDRRLSIDKYLDGALAQFYSVYRDNPISELPQVPHSPQPANTSVSSHNGKGISIACYNATHDIEDLLRFYGARPARRRGLYFCPFHSDEHAVWASTHIVGSATVAASAHIATARYARSERRVQRLLCR